MMIKKSYSFDVNCSLSEFATTNLDIVRIAGRVLSKKDFGALVFLTIKDFDGTVQISISKQTFDEIDEYKSNIKRGDIIGVTGSVYYTQTKTKTVQAKEIHVLCEAKKALPDKWFGLEDIEKKQHLRYIDILQDEETISRIKKRLKIISGIEEFLTSQNFIKVETPILGFVASGAAANPFKTHHDALKADMFLRVAPELNLKRYLIAGFNRVFEIAKCFRNEGIDTTHLQEFTMVEAYQTYISYDALKQLACEVLRSAVRAIEPSLILDDLDFNKIEEISYTDFIRKYVEIEPKDWFNEPLLRTIASEKNINISDCKTTVSILDKLYKKLGLSNIKQPLLISNYYKSPLAKESDHDALTSEQFQIILCSREVVKSCLEMNDPVKQLQNFEDQSELQKAGDPDCVKTDYSFIEALEYGMPPAGGLGMGIDRIVTILTGASSIKETIMFPQEKSNL